MRALLVSLALVLPLAAGCLAAETPAPAAVGAVPLGAIEVPAGATLIEELGKSTLRFADIDLPFETTITVPEGATIIRARATVADQVGVSTSMSNEETGRRRCNTDAVDSWGLGITLTNTCSGLAAIDPPGSKWVVRASSAALVGVVDIVFETTPLDGIAAQLDLTQLSMPTHELEETVYTMVPSFDGTNLWVEYTLPKGEGPWPTVIASSPYNTMVGRGTTPAMWEYWSHDWAKRGYAVVNADVRGYGMSEGCVEVWSENEQKDQAFLVDWVAQQEWSDGNVGFYGQSYVATTPVAAAVQAPEALKAIIAVAPVINAYYDWHFGGVPNGESTGSPAAYQVLTDTPSPEGAMAMDPLAWAMLSANNFCDPTLAARANDPRAIYDAFYEERNFSARADKITAAVLFTQGFEDSNVKSRMIPEWFNAITAPKLGVFGHWVHQHPTRADEEVMFLGWMDQYVKGKPLGFDQVDPVHVIVDDATYRVGATWPPEEAVWVALPQESAAGAQIALAPAAAPMLPTEGITLEIPIENDTYVAGIPLIAIEGMLLPAGNAHFYAELYDVGDDGEKLMSYGAFNLAHRGGHDTWTPSAPGETTSFELPFIPTEHVWRAGHTMRIVLRGVAADTLAPESTSQPGVYTIGALSVVLPTMDASLYTVAPATATR